MSTEQGVPICAFWHLRNISLKSSLEAAHVACRHSLYGVKLCFLDREMPYSKA